MKSFFNLAMMACALLIASACLAASVTFEVDTLDQEYDAIELFLANKPRVIDVTQPPAYSGMATRFTVSNLADGQTYDFAARLKHGDLASELSNIITHKTPIAATTNKPPQMAFVGYTDTGGVILSVEDFNQTYDSIRLHGAKDGEQINWSVAGFYVGKDKLITVTGLPRGERWKFEAVLRTGQTATAPSNTVIVDIPAVQVLAAPGLMIIKVE